MKEIRTKCANCSNEWTNHCGSSCPVCMSEQYEVVKERRIVDTQFNGGEPLEWAESVRSTIESVVDDGYTFDGEHKGFIYFSR